MSYTTVWLQYRWAGVDRLWTYFAVNALLWAACGLLVYWIAVALSGSSVAGSAAAAVVLTSSQLIDSMAIIVERQSSMACLFGLAAWLVIISKWDRARPRSWVAVSLLLTASALSKEYGLAFAAAVGLFATGGRRWPMAWSTLAAVALYVVLRVGLAGGALAPYCEEHGYFGVTRTVCFDTLDREVVSQGFYNVVATSVGSLAPGVVADDGRISVSPRWLLVSLVILAIAALGWLRGPRSNRIGWLVIACNALLSVLLHRFRNQAAALCALGVAFGAGLPLASSRIRALSPSRPARILAAALLFGALAMRATVTRSLLSERVEASHIPEACGPDAADPDRLFIERVRDRYNAALPECIGADAVR
jgi:hypothetical protein